MIISRLNGRLGNQMFQYAVAYALAKSHSMPLGIFKFECDIKKTVYELNELRLDRCNKYLRIPFSLYRNTAKEAFGKLLKKTLREKKSGGGSQ